MNNIDILTAKEMPVLHLNGTTDIVPGNLKMPVSEEKGILKTSYK